MSKLVKKYSSLSAPAKYVLWGVYGAIFWGGLMTLFFFWVDTMMGNDPWKHLGYTLVVSFVLGAWVGASSCRRIERTVQARSQP